MQILKRTLSVLRCAVVRPIPALQSTRGVEAVLALAAFTVWTGASFLCHRLARTAVLFFGHHFLAVSPLLAPVMVTLWQVTTCHCTVSFPGRRGRHLLWAVMAVSHTAATLDTNASLTLIFASSALAVKLLEPMTSAVMQSLVLRQPVRLEAVVSLVGIVLGAVLFVGDPLQSVPVLRGVWLALMSNVVLGVRNVALKLHQQASSSWPTGGTARGSPPAPEASSNNTGGGGQVVSAFDSASGSSTPSATTATTTSTSTTTTSTTTTANTSLRSFHHVATFALVCATLVACVYAMETKVYAVPRGSVHFLLLCMGSAVCHVLYSYVSTHVMLRCMSVVGHSLANIVKRVLVVLLLHLSGQRTTTAQNWLGLVLCTAGLLLYNGRHILPALGATPESSSSSASSGDSPDPQDGGFHPKRIRLLQRMLVVVVLLHAVLLIPGRMGGVTPRVHAPRLTHSPPLPHTLWSPLVPGPVPFQPPETDQVKVDAFLGQENLLLMANNTDQLSPYLATSHQVVQEAARVHDNLLSNLLRGKRYFILIGAASFENKGDPAITVGQVRVLERLKLKMVFLINEVSCSNDKFLRAKAIADDLPRDQLVIVMQGGGNIIGYPGPNHCRMRSLQHFPDHQTVLLSQSVYMRGRQDWVRTMSQTYCCRPQLSIFLRDRLSFRIASRLFPNGTRLVLAPDMAFGVGSVPRLSPPFYDVLWLKRFDGERPKNASDHPERQFPSGVTVKVADWFHASWNTPKGTTSLETAHNVLQNGFLFLQRGRVVVTERLHGHILSTLLDIPHVVLDNEDHKLSSYHLTWTRGLHNVRMARTQTEAVSMSLELLKLYGTQLPPLFPGTNIRE